MLLRKIFYLLLLFSASGYTQQRGSLSGKVIDKTTGEPLIKAGYQTQKNNFFHAFE
jgi:hypothetical protein